MRPGTAVAIVGGSAVVAIVAAVLVWLVRREQERDEQQAEADRKEERGKVGRFLRNVLDVLI